MRLPQYLSMTAEKYIAPNPEENNKLSADIFVWVKQSLCGKKNSTSYEHAEILVCS